jgi:hypothetical protein
MGGFVSRFRIHIGLGSMLFYGHFRIDVFMAGAAAEYAAIHLPRRMRDRFHSFGRVDPL